MEVFVSRYNSIDMDYIVLHVKFDGGLSISFLKKTLYQKNEDQEFTMAQPFLKSGVWKIRNFFWCLCRWSSNDKWSSPKGNEEAKKKQKRSMVRLPRSTSKMQTTLFVMLGKILPTVIRRSYTMKLRGLDLHERFLTFHNHATTDPEKYTYILYTSPILFLRKWNGRMHVFLTVKQRLAGKIILVMIHVASFVR
jgi:hypothetical protein